MMNYDTGVTILGVYVANTYLLEYWPVLASR